MTVVYAEPDEAGGDAVFRLTEAEAVAQQRAVAKMRGVEYATDAEALDDFMATHWAWLEEE